MSMVFEENTAPAFNFLFKVIGPVVFFVLCGVFFQSIGLNFLVKNCYFIVIYYWIFRFVWTLIENRFHLFDWIQQIIYWTSSIGLAIWIYSNIEKVDKILPDGKGLIDQMWILIIAFLYTTINKLNIGQYRSLKRKDNYIKARYKKFKDKYGDIITAYFNNPFYEALTFSIMIYEDFNRPFIIRQIENLRFKLTHKKHTLGIMQVMTDNYVNDQQSVLMALAKIARDNNEYINNFRRDNIENPDAEIYFYHLIDHIAKKYNGGNPKYSNEITKVFDKLMELEYNGEIPTNFITIDIQ